MFNRKSWAPKLKRKNEDPPNSCPSLASDSSDLSHNLGEIQFRTSSLDINGLLNEVNISMGYQSDEESIQASPILESSGNFDPINFQEQRPASFIRENDHKPAPIGGPDGPASGPISGPISGPVTGNSSELAPKGPTPAENRSSINFTKQHSPNPSFSIYSFGDHKERGSDDDEDEALPFETTKRMASLGVGLGRNILPEIRTGIVMTNDKFETYRKSLHSLDMLDRQNSIVSHAAQSDEEDEDEDDLESNRKDRLHKQQLALARQQQEAHLSVHRQKMNKMVGGELVHSTTFDQIAQDDSDIMEDVPLSILRAHGFPKTVKKRETASNSPEMSNFDSTTKAGAAAGNLSTPSTPGLRRSPVVPNANRLSQQIPLPPVFKDGSTFTGGKGLVGEIAREEEAKRNRVGRSATQTALDSGLPYVDSRQSIAPMARTAADPMLHDIRMQMQQMSEMQYQLMQMASGTAPVTPDSGSIRYSRAASMRSFGAVPPPQQYTPTIPFSPTFTTNTVSARPSVQDLHSYRARPVRPSQEQEDEDEDEAWRKFAEKRQTLKSQWISAE